MININLKEVLAKKRISQTELSKISGLSTWVINKIANEKRVKKLDLHDLDILCKSLDLQPGDLLSHTD